MISGQIKVHIGCLGGLLDLINTFKRPNELRIRFQLSTKVPAKVVTF
jgi:hypothetical protein